jgi:alkylation response protein AidB-like acyl-CoA dehydrogenase
MSLKPESRAALREDILARIESIRPIIERHAEDSQQLRELPEPSWRAIADAGLFGLKVPAQLGGFDADAALQIEAIERVSYFDGSAGWTLMVGLGAAGMAAGWAEESALRLLVDGERLRRGALCLAPTGKATPVDGGYRLSGRWGFASGSHHAEWIVVTAAVEGTSPPRIQSFFVDASQMVIEDTWNVTGLKGTGSSHVTVTDIFIPSGNVLAPAFGPPRRGGPVLRMGQPGLVVCEHAAFALGVARRMVDETASLARSKMRGITVKKSIADNQHFQSSLGMADIRLKAAREYVLAVFERAHRDVVAGQVLDTDRQLELRLSAVHATDVALEVCDALVRFAGTTAVYTGNVIERCLRDIHAGSQHHLIASGAYEPYARRLLGFPDVTPFD